LGVLLILIIPGLVPQPEPYFDLTLIRVTHTKMYQPKDLNSCYGEIPIIKIVTTTVVHLTAVKSSSHKERNVCLSAPDEINASTR